MKLNELAQDILSMIKWRMLDKFPYYTPRHYELDDHFRLLYGARLENHLMPCQRVTDPNLVVGIIDNRHINPRRLLIIPKDQEPIVVQRFDPDVDCQINFPGKSAFIYFGGPPDRESLQSIIARQLQNTPDRRDHFHLSTVAKVDQAGWQVWWAPLQMRCLPLHLRLIHPNTINSNSLPSIDEAQKLASAFECLS